MRKLTNDEFLLKVNERFPNIIPLEPYKNRRTKILVQCKNCGDTKYVSPNMLLYGDDSGDSCRTCYNKKQAKRMSERTKGKYKTALVDEFPDLEKYLKDKSELYKYGIGTRGNIDLKCPDCGCEFTKNIWIFVKSMRNGIFPCPICSVGKSFPNKFMKIILDELNIKYVSEYNQPWSKMRRYDFYFELNNKKYIIEMDGGLHTSKNKHIDDWKDAVAKEHDIHVIRVDCNYTNDKRFEHIKNNIIKELSFLFDFSNFDFDKCNKLANIGILKLFADSWERNKDLYKVCKELDYSHDIAIKYLKLTEKYSLSSYNYKEDYEKRNKEKIDKYKKPVFCVETGETFDSRKTAQQKYGGRLSHYFNSTNINKYCGKLEDGTELHWIDISKCNQ